MTRSFLVSAFVASALLGSPAAARGQEQASSGTKTIGIIGGVDFSTLTGNNVSNAASRTGFMGGLFLGIRINPSVEVEPEVLYAMKGSDFSGTDTTVALNYIEVPILVKYSFSPNGGIYVLAGPAVNFDVSSDVPPIPTTGGSSVNPSPNLTFGGVLGLGYARRHLGFEGRYDFDFSDALALDSFTNLDAKNRVWALLVRVSR
jgi:hypothetical protein